MKRLLLFTLLLLLAAESNTSAQTKKILLEEFTGTWCGWCPRGIYAIDQMLAKYPGQFIPISFHNSDPMQISTGQDTLENTVPGYPNGWIDRKNFSGKSDTKWNLDPGDWDAVVTQRLNDAVQATVAIQDVSYDATTKTVNAKLVVNFLAALTGDLRVNLYLTEDSVSGAKGTQYDQHSYLTFRGGYEDNPFFPLPPTVPGYYHMHVVRYVAGGAWGTTGGIPASVTSGSNYTVNFSFPLPDGVTINPEHCWLVGAVMNTNTSNFAKSEVYNAEMVKLTNPAYKPLAAAMAVSSSKKYITAARSGQTTQTVTISNPTSNELKAYLNVDNIFSTLPTNWTASIAPTSVTIPANGSTTATLTFTAPANSGYATAVVGVLPYNDEGSIGVSTEVKVSALSENTKYAAFGYDSYIAAHPPTNYVNDFASLPLSDEVMAAYPPTSFDVGIFPGIELLDHSDQLTGAPPSIAPIVNQMLSSGKKALLTGEYAMYYAFDANSPYAQYTTDQLTTLFDKLGIEYSNLVSHVNSNGQRIASSKLTGFAGDMIGDGITNTTCNNNYYDAFSLSNNNSVVSMYFDNDQTIPAAIRYDGGSANRLVYLDFNLADISSTATTSKIFNRSMDFLLNGVNSVKIANAGAEVSATNYPNPAAGGTKFVYSVTERGPVSLVVRDIMGREVASVLSNQIHDAGTYEADFNVANLATGTYTYVLTTGDKTVTNTLTVVK